MNINRGTKVFQDMINICELPEGHKIFRKIDISALSGRHCGPHSSSIKHSILNWHDRLFLPDIFGEFVQCMNSLLYILDNDVTHNTSRRTAAAGWLIALLVHLLLTTVAWYSTRSSIVPDLHNHTNVARRPQRVMQTELSVQWASNI